MKKIFLSIIIPIVLALTIALLISCSGDEDASDKSYFVSGEIHSLSVNPFGKDKDSPDTVSWSNIGGEYYLFLPNKQTPDLTLYLEASGTVYINGSPVRSGDKADSLLTDGTAYIRCGEEEFPLHVLRGSDIPSVFITTESGGLDAIHADKEHKESGTMTVFGEDAGQLFSGELDYIKGRGNSTWEWEKKPYNIKLEDKASFFGMEKSKKWSLIACLIDTTMNRNALASELANAVGISYTPTGQHVNLYINGEFQGMYYFMERVEIDSSRIDIHDLEKATEDVNDKDLDKYSPAGQQGNLIADTVKYFDIPNNPEDISGGYLLEFEAFSRYASELSGFVTKQSQPIVVKSPEYVTKAQVEYISALYQKFEDAIYSPTGYNSEGKHYSEYIDLESLARMYILQDYTENYDGCNQSFFIYKDIGGVMTFGPAWDFDHALGQGGVDTYNTDGTDTAIPDQFFLKNWRMSGRTPSVRSLLGQAYMHEDFQALVSRLWVEEYMPYNDTWIKSAEKQTDTVSGSIVMNAIRWNTYQTMDVDVIESKYKADSKALLDFIKARYEFLTKAYSKNTFYVKYDSNTFGYNFINDDTMYKNGDQAKVMKAVRAKSGYVFVSWNTMPDGSGVSYAPGDKLNVDGNITLYAEWKKR